MNYLVIGISTQTGITILNIFNLNREELLLNIHRDVWRLSKREIDG